MTNYSNLFILIIQAITLGWKPRVCGLIQEDKKIEISQKDIMNEIEILAKQIDDNNVQ